jgi:hypothetical protein
LVDVEIVELQKVVKLGFLRLETQADRTLVADSLAGEIAY